MSMKMITQGPSEEMDMIRTLLLPRLVRQLALESENYEKRIKEGEKQGNVPKSDLKMMWMETITKKDLFKTNTGLTYESPLEITRNEKLVLMKIFQDLSGFSWSRNFGWIGQGLAKGRLEINVFEASSSLYDGISTIRVSESRETVGNVQRIELGGVGCSGTLPQSLSQLEECTFLCMNWNLITGNLPRQLGNLTKMMDLDLSGNALTGQLDVESFQALTSLRTLDLSFNCFEGCIPDAFYSMTQLTLLNLSGNFLTGTLPSSLSQLTALQDLRLYSNQLSGAIPSTFSALQQLQRVNLSQNLLTSGLSAFNNCTNLHSLDLSCNALRGRLDQSLIPLRHRLQLLYLQNNRISGIIPPELCILIKLQRINLSHNNLRGVLPYHIGELINLETLLLTGNNIIGPVPTSISKLTKLRDFHIFRSYPAEITMPAHAFQKQTFQRVYEFGPSVGINSVHWSYEQVYGRERGEQDDESVTLFSGLL